MSVTKEMAQVIAQKSPVAVKMAKTLINENQEMKKRLEREIDLLTGALQRRTVWKA